jgi:hypothetical protein
MTELFRGMKEDPNGMPEIGESSRSLGVRPGIDVPAKDSGDLVRPGHGGMSVSPDDPHSLPTMIDDRIQQALMSSAPVNELRDLALHLLAGGQTREAILELLERARQELRLANRETDEDAVMDVMDFLVGWCSPHMKLPPEQPTAVAPGT